MNKGFEEFSSDPIFLLWKIIYTEKSYIHQQIQYILKKYDGVKNLKYNFIGVYL